MTPGGISVALSLRTDPLTYELTADLLRADLVANVSVSYFSLF